MSVHVNPFRFPPLRNFKKFFQNFFSSGHPIKFSNEAVLQRTCSNHGLILDVNPFAFLFHSWAEFSGVPCHRMRTQFRTSSVLMMSFCTQCYVPLHKSQLFEARLIFSTDTLYVIVRNMSSHFLFKRIENLKKNKHLANRTANCNVFSTGLSSMLQFSTILDSNLLLV